VPWQALAAALASALASLGHSLGKCLGSCHEKCLGSSCLGMRLGMCLGKCLGKCLPWRVADYKNSRFARFFGFVPTSLMGNHAKRHWKVRSADFGIFLIFVIFRVFITEKFKKNSKSR
jgi:hypothetical protein